MFNLPANSYLIVIFIFFQGFLVLLVLFLFIDKFLSTKKIRLENELLKQQAFLDAKKALEDASLQTHKQLADAHTQSLSIISAASQKASEITNQSQHLQNEIKQQIADNARQLVEQQNADFSSLMSEFEATLKGGFNREKEQILSSFNTMFSAFQAEAVEQLSMYRQMLTKSSMETQNMLHTKTESYLAQLKSELDLYQKEKYAKINVLAVESLSSICLEFFGQTLTVADHEDLILKLVEKVKLQNEYNV